MWYAIRKNGKYWANRTYYWQDTWVEDANKAAIYKMERVAKGMVTRKDLGKCEIVEVEITPVEVVSVWGEQ